MRTLGEDNIELLEKDLLRSLRPVQPNPEFVTRLHSHLAAPTTTYVETRRSPAYSLGVAVVGVGLTIGLFFFWLGRLLRR